jgi:two-component system, chemotaxis family, chemotaxis protein CheY
MPRILIVDDVATIRKIVTAVLGGVGYQVTESASAADALAICESKGFHLLLVDVEMPGMNGLELISRLRTLKTCRSTPIVILAKDGRDENIRRAETLGANGWIEKPFTPERLLSAINQVLVDHYVN